MYRNKVDLLQDDDSASHCCTVVLLISASSHKACRPISMFDTQAGGRAFPLRLPTYTAQELDSHIAGDHPKCQFCGTHFYEREQWEMHMMANHPYCELCDADFRNAEEFTEHLRLAVQHLSLLQLVDFVLQRFEVDSIEICCELELSDQNTTEHVCLKVCSVACC